MAEVLGSPAPDVRGRPQMRISPGQASAERHVSSAESREFQTEGFTQMPTSPDATSGPVTRQVTYLLPCQQSSETGHMGSETAELICGVTSRH